MGPIPSTTPAEPETPPAPRAERNNDFARVFREVREAGLMERRRVRHLAAVAFNAVVLAAAITIFVVVGDSWWQMLTAILFAVVFTQCGFIGHDAGHRQIFASRRANDVIGYLHGDLLIGLGYGWWVDKHDAHHANPNHDERDPDVDLGVLALTDWQAEGRTGVVGFIIRHQALLFFPMLMLEGFDLHVSAVRSIIQRVVPRRRTEIVLLTLHAVLYFGGIFLVLSPGKAVVFILVHQMLFGLYLGCSFAPNHKGMPMLSAADKLDPLRKQVLTSRNIDGGRWIDVALGGLNHQIEHHLFPRMPRANLRRARPIVRDFCAREGIPYLETGLVESYAQGLRHLRAVGASA